MTDESFFSVMGILPVSKRNSLTEIKIVLTSINEYKLFS